jgi:hypothetical protein
LFAGKHALEHLKWLAIASVAIGLPVILLRAVAGLRRGLLDINILMTVAVAGKSQAQPAPADGASRSALAPCVTTPV